jgi:hypothetical protein
MVHSKRDAAELVFLTASIAALGIVACKIGISNCWDLRNYHLYDGWAFWTGRGDRDFAAAQLQTYFNPLMATGSYLLLTSVAPWLSAFLLGALQGANVVPLYVLARRFLPQSIAWRTPLAALIALAGVCGAIQMRELGGTIADNVVSIPLLCAYALMYSAPPLGARRIAVAGALAGIAAGLKLTAALFVLGLLAAPAFLGEDRRESRRMTLRVASSVLGGFLLVDGFWLLHLQQAFGNPLYPMFSGFFGGEYAVPFPVRDERFLPHAWLEWLLYPVFWIADPRRVSELRFFDLRIPLALLCAPALFWRGGDAPLRRPLRAMAASLLMAYFSWLVLFGIYRYLAPLEMLAPLVIALAIAAYLSRRATWVASGTLAAIMVTTHTKSEARLEVSGSSFLEIELPASFSAENATIVFAENEPLAFLALGFPPSTHFVRIAGSLLGPPRPEYAMDHEAARRLESAQGGLYAVLAKPDNARVIEALARQDLAVTYPCAPIHSNLLAPVDTIQLCPLSPPP